MNTKSLLVITILNFGVGSCFADATIVPPSRENTEALPASPFQRQVLATRPLKTGEFARFEAIPMRATTSTTYEGRVLSQSQLEVLGKNIK